MSIHFLRSDVSLGPSWNSTQIAESHGTPTPGLSELRVEVQVTVLRAVNIPSIKKYGFLKRKIFVAVSRLATRAKTTDVPVVRHMASWNQNLDSLFVPPNSHLTLRLYAKWSAHSSIIIGTHEMPIPLASQSDVPCVLENEVGETMRSMQPVTLYVTVNVIPPALYNNNPSIPTEDDVFPAEEALIPARGRTQPASPEQLLPSSHHQPAEAGNNEPQSREEASPAITKDLRLALDHADKAMKRIDRSTTWQGAVRRIKWVMDTLGPIAGLFPLAKMAHGLLLAIPETLLKQYETDDNVQTLLRAIHYAFDFGDDEGTLLIESRRPESKQARILTEMLKDVGTCCDFIQSYAQGQFWKRTLKNIGNGPDNKIKELSDILVKRRIAFLDQAVITVEVTAFQILDKVANISTQLQDLSNQLDEAKLDAIIDKIPHGVNSRFSPDKGCLLGTRVAFLEFINNWVNDPNPDSERGLVLLGQAGTGKSSIAHEIAHLFDRMHRLTSSFIFSRSEQSERKAPYHLFTTLARHLSDRYPSFKIALGKAVKDNTDLQGGTHDYRTLFESLILKPLEDVHTPGPVLVVIDALDESGDATGRTGLHSFLAENLKRLPSNFRVVITSRSEHDIASVLVEAQSVNIRYMNDPELAAETDKDILTFLRAKLPTNKFGDYVEALAVKAEKLFQWAAVACQLVLDPPERFYYDEVTCIKHLSDPSSNFRGLDKLDELYKEVLEGYFKEKETRALISSVVGQLILSIEPLTIRSLITLRQHASPDKRDGAAVTGLLRRLGSLLSNVNSSDDNLPIIPLHTSFRDFLTSKDKSSDFYVDDRDTHDQSAHSCLNLLLNPIEGLKFNICELETSYLANDDVEDLKIRVDQHIPPALLYACRFWVDHLKHTDFKTGLLRNVETLIKEKYLFWLEALSLTRNIGLAPSAFATLNMWLASSQGDSRGELDELTSFVNDAAVFVRHFAIAIAKSAPHIYLSALPFAPTCSLVSTNYSTSFRRILCVERGQLSHWPSLEMVISNLGAVLSVGFSRDGKHIVSGSFDGSVRVWNAKTGEIAAGPFTGHTHSVRSVAFSPDGQHIASGSYDETIRVWNAKTGETAAGPFTGHTNWVTSVAFSPDGQHIVSGSYDQTIRVWNAKTGETAAGPFTGHTNWVTSVAFSPDGQHIVSSSSDRSIRVWNAKTGETTAGPLTGHTNSVRSVAFSPDGQHVASGSSDQSIRVWNAKTGEAVAGPFTGHTNWVRSVAFSPDGQHIVSGSKDRSIRVWNAKTGETVAGPFTGHTNWVTSVAFSPDGQHIVSGSEDRSIRVWNAKTGETAAGPFTGHASPVTSVAFSPDGQHIVSGSYDESIPVWNSSGEHIFSSYDESIRVWNAKTGENATGPFAGHTDWVTSVAFSQDGQHIVSGSFDGSIRVWNAKTGETAAGPFTGHTNWVTSVAFSPDGQHVVSGSNDQSIRVWNAKTGETTAGPFTGHTDYVRSVAFSPDGQHVVSGSNDQSIRVWNAKTGETTAGPLTGHTDHVRSVAFSPDGQHIVSGSNDRSIRVWNAKTGEITAGPLTGHSDHVRSVAFSPGGQHIISSSNDRSIRIWNATTEETVAGPFTGHMSSVTSVAFSPDGQHIVSGSEDGMILMSNATVGKMGTTNDVDFTDYSTINDEGWICGSNGELLIWIPSEHRKYLHRPSTIWISGGCAILNLSNFVHGRNWGTCITT